MKKLNNPDLLAGIIFTLLIIYALAANATNPKSVQCAMMRTNRQMCKNRTLDSSRLCHVHRDKPKEIVMTKDSTYYRMIEKKGGGR